MNIGNPRTSAIADMLRNSAIAFESLMMPVEVVATESTIEENDNEVVKSVYKKEINYFSTDCRDNSFLSC